MFNRAIHQGITFSSSSFRTECSCSDTLRGMGDGDKILNSASVRLGILGVQVTELARQRLEPLGLAPKQVGLMAFVDSRTKASQREIASGMRVAPSLVVTLVDQLEALKAVTRIRRPGDRRVQEISLTEVGRKLLSEALVVVRALDEDLTAHLADGDRRALDRTLEAVENGRWLPDLMGRGSAD